MQTRLGLNAKSRASGVYGKGCGASPTSRQKIVAALNSTSERRFCNNQWRSCSSTLYWDRDCATAEPSNKCPSFYVGLNLTLASGVRSYSRRHTESGTFKLIRQRRSRQGPQQVRRSLRHQLTAMFPAVTTVTDTNSAASVLPVTDSDCGLKDTWVKPVVNRQSEPTGGWILIRGQTLGRACGPCCFLNTLP